MALFEEPGYVFRPDPLFRHQDQKVIGQVGDLTDRVLMMAIFRGDDDLRAFLPHLLSILSIPWSNKYRV